MMGGERTAAFDAGQDNLGHELKLFKDFIEEHKAEIPKDLERAAKIFFNKILHGIKNVRVNDLSQDKQFYITKLQEAKTILGNLNHPIYLATELNRLHDQTKNYLNQYLKGRLSYYKFLSVFSSILVIAAIAFTIAAVIAFTGICPPLSFLISKAFINVGGTIGALSLGVLSIGTGYLGNSIFNACQKTIQDKISINNQDIIPVLRQAIV